MAIQETVTRSVTVSIMCILYTGKISPRFIFALFALWPEGEFKTGLIELFHETLGEWANSRLGDSVSDLCTAKIRLGELKDVYNITINKKSNAQCNMHKF